jgi:hypothetical protein
VSQFFLFVIVFSSERKFFDDKDEMHRAGLEPATQ